MEGREGRREGGSEKRREGRSMEEREEGNTLSFSQWEQNLYFQLFKTGGNLYTPSLSG